MEDQRGNNEGDRNFLTRWESKGIRGLISDSIVSRATISCSVGRCLRHHFVLIDQLVTRSVPGNILVTVSKLTSFVYGAKLQVGRGGPFRVRFVAKAGFPFFGFKLIFCNRIFISFLRRNPVVCCAFAKRVIAEIRFTHDRWVGGGPFWGVCATISCSLTKF